MRNTKTVFLKKKMALPGNGIFVVRGETTALITAMKRGVRWSSHSYQEEELDNLVKNLQDLKVIVNKIEDLKIIDSILFVNPFLEIIRSEDTTGHVTSLALMAIHKFLSYGLLDSTHYNSPVVVDNIADAVTHAKFVGTDQSSDGVVLMKILQVLRTLTLSAEGVLLTNDSLCEIMLACFRICFETRLSELLRRTAELYLKDMVQLVFMRLPQFSEDLKFVNMKHLKMKSVVMEHTTRNRRKSKLLHKNKRNAVSSISIEKDISEGVNLVVNSSQESKIDESKNNIVDMQGSISQDDKLINLDAKCDKNIEKKAEGSEDNLITKNQEMKEGVDDQDSLKEERKDVSEKSDVVKDDQMLQSRCVEMNDLKEGDGVKTKVIKEEDYVNRRGIRFTLQNEEESWTLHPYGIACVREMFHFLISLCNPLDKQNTDAMIHLGLSLLTVTFEIGADSIGKYDSLLILVKNNLCRNLISLLQTERISIFAVNLQVSFLMFEALRMHLKFQMEFYLTKLIDIVTSDVSNLTYEHRELALDYIVQLWKIPGFVTELYVNYDCSMYCSNLFEDLTKLLAKNAFPLATGVYNTHLLSLDALLAVIENIEIHCAEATKMKFDVHHNATTTTTTTTVTKSNEGANTSYNNKVDSLGISTTAVAVRQKKSENVPTKDNLMKIKEIKKWLPQGNEYFNHKPEKGVQFLQDHGVLENDDIVSFLRENPALDKAKIGEYISHKKNFKILEAFVKMFDFTGTRIDSALRMYLETFRLPGEAQLISRLLEHFAEHWHKCNGEPFKNADAAFTLAYAIIILNVDQHNSNVKRQNNPMTCEDFKKNLKGVNGGTDFDESMLDEIYNAIKNEEIVMPAEHTGLVKENYMWKFLLRRGLTNEGFYFHTGSNEDVFDENIFCLIWGPIMSALSFVFNKSEDANVYRRALNGFVSSASISAHFGMTNNLDMLILTLSKFTLLYHNGNNNLNLKMSSSSSTMSTNCAVAFGTSAKAQAAFTTMFAMVHQYGDNIRDGWKHVFSVIVTLYSVGLLPEMFLEVEDFTEPNGKILLVCEPTVQVQKQELSGILSSLYSYMISSSSPPSMSTSASISSGNSNNKAQQRTPQQQQAEKCVQQCNLDQLLIDSKFLHEEALLELVKALVEMSRGPDVEKFLGYIYNENLTVFFLELLLKVVTQNRDRVMTIWNIVHNHLYTLMMNASHFDYQFLLERSVIGLLRLAIRLMRNEEMSPVVVQSLRMLLLLKSTIIYKISVQISCGLYELLKTSAQNIHTSTDWSIIFTLLECVGAGAQPPKPLPEDSYHLDDERKSEGDDGGGDDDNIGDDFGGNYGDEVTTSSDKGNTSDVELKASSRSQSPLSPFLNVTDPLTPSNTPTNPGGWILVGGEGDVQPVIGRTPPADQYSLALECNLGPHKPKALLKCCESLAFLVRDVAHITPYNFDNCIHCVRTFAEASLNGRGIRSIPGREFRSRKKATGSIKSGSRGTSPSNSSSPNRDEKREGGEDDDDDEENSDDEYIPNGYHQISIQLLDLMHTLHTRTAQIFRWWAEEGGVIAQETSLWSQGWCPLLQGIARLCCDNRRQVRMSALTYLQRALLVHDLETLNGFEWEACFHRVLFPLLTLLLQPNINPKNPQFLEETRMRAATLLSKVFLHHLTPLLSLPSFTNLWLNIIDFMDKYMHADRSELLYEAIPESLKNMLLVMESANVFKEKVNAKDQLWFVTWDRISKFLPNLRNELFNEGDHKQQIKPSHLEKVAGSESEKVTETRPKSSVTVTITEQSNVENVTRCTVVIAPDTGGNNSNNVASSLFSHLGQMVSTPIVAHHEVKKKNISNVVPSSTLPNDVSESKGDVVPSNSNSCTLRRDNGGAATPHVFPVLYTSPPSDAEITSLFGDYVRNPYHSAVVVNSDRDDDLNNGKTKSDISKNGQFSDSPGASVNLLSNYF